MVGVDHTGGTETKVERADQPQAPGSTAQPGDRDDERGTEKPELSQTAAEREPRGAQDSDETMDDEPGVE